MPLYDWTDLLLPVAGTYEDVPDDVFPDGLVTSLSVDTMPDLFPATLLLELEDDADVYEVPLLPPLVPVADDVLLGVEELVLKPCLFTGVRVPASFLTPDV